MSTQKYSGGSGSPRNYSGNSRNPRNYSGNYRSRSNNYRHFSNRPKRSPENTTSPGKKPPSLVVSPTPVRTEAVSIESESPTRSSSPVTETPAESLKTPSQASSQESSEQNNCYQFLFGGNLSGWMPYSDQQRVMKRPDGPHIVKDVQGNVIESGQFYQGLPEGIWYRTSYQNISYDSNPVLVREKLSYNQGKLQGPWIKLNEQNQLISLKHFNQDLPHGIWIERNHLGETWVIHYQTGRIVQSYQLA